MKLYFPKLSLGSKKLGKPSNPFTTKKVSITVPALKAKMPIWKKKFVFQLPIKKV